MSIVYSRLRDFLDSRGCNLQQHSSRRIMMTLATNLYDEGEDREAATSIVNDVIALGRRNNRSATRREGNVTLSNLTSSAHEASSSSSSDRIAHNVAMRLKENDKKFSGELGQSWMEFVDEYLQMCRDYSLSPTQRLQYLHNLLRGDAKRFYLDKVDGYASSFQQAVQMIHDEYNSHVRQTRIKDYLNTIRVSNFMEKGISATDALSKVYQLIVKLARQAPQSFRGDVNKVEYLRNAVVGHGWAKEPLSRVGTMSLTFQQLHAELAASLQLENDTQRAIQRDKGNHMKDNQPYQVNFFGQGRYKRRTSAPRFRTPQNKFNPLNIQGCFNCGGQHLMKDCTRPIDSAKAATRGIEYYAKRKNKQYAVHSVQADLCAQLDENSLNDYANTSDKEDHEIFQALVADHHSNEVELNNSTSDSSDDEVHNLVLKEGDDHGINEVHAVNTSYIIHSASKEQNFRGACVDSAAQKTVIGKPQATAYIKEYGDGTTIVQYGEQSPVFSFGTHKHKADGYIDIRIPVDDNAFLTVRAAVVKINIPFLLGLETMMIYKMVIDVDDKKIYSKRDGWTMGLCLKGGHLYHEWKIGILFTQQELRKVHNHFYHPEPDRLYSLFKRADPSSTSQQLLQDLDRINSTCDTCHVKALPHIALRSRWATAKLFLIVKIVSIL